MHHFTYLHPVGDSTFWLDHRLTPEVSAMIAAMASRAPAGGVRARYAQIVEAVAETLYDEWDGIIASRKWAEAKDDVCTAPHDNITVGDFHRALAEDRLCEYPLHPKVQQFFDDFVGKYGHSSILELIGRPAIYVENISWLTAWLTFDSPLCAGQEFSTRAVQHKNWPMARECFRYRHDPEGVHDGPPTHYEEGGIAIHAEPGDKGSTYTYGNLDLQRLHKDWFDVFDAEVTWWKQHFSTDANRRAHGIKDKEPFRPALDRARWALPGTIATGCSHTSNLRERSRVIRDGLSLSRASGAGASVAVWEEIADAYREALPGLAGMGLREAVYAGGDEYVLPGHLKDILSDASDGPDVKVGTRSSESDRPVSKRTRSKSYLDPAANVALRVDLTFRCSLAVARDWHRHRTLYPWHLQVVRTPEGHIGIDRHYTPMSDFAKSRVPALLIRSSDVFDKFMSSGNIVQAALALPLGTRVRLRGQGGLRDVIYMLELRHTAAGANFEYREQAGQAIDFLRASLRASIQERFGIFSD